MQAVHSSWYQQAALPVSGWNVTFSCCKKQLHTPTKNRVTAHRGARDELALHSLKAVVEGIFKVLDASTGLYYFA